jgi:uncharacterized membrane protein YdbT with pleckstrin-like domain
MSEERLVLRFRRLASTTVVAPRGRLQSRGFSVSPFQRRLRLATLEIEVASGRGGTGFRLVDLGREAAGKLMEALSARATPMEAPARERFT